MHQPQATLKPKWKWEQNATCYCSAQVPKKMILLLQFALAASQFPKEGGEMELILPCKSLLSLLIYLAIAHFLEKEGMLKPLERTVSAQED